MKWLNIAFAKKETAKKIKRPILYFFFYDKKKHPYYNYLIFLVKN